MAPGTQVGGAVDEAVYMHIVSTDEVETDKFFALSPTLSTAIGHGGRLPHRGASDDLKNHWVWNPV